VSPFVVLEEWPGEGGAGRRQGQSPIRQAGRPEKARFRPGTQPRDNAPPEGEMKRDNPASQNGANRTGLSLGFGLFPSAPGGLYDHALFEGARGDTDVTHFTIDQGLDALEIGHETPLGNRGYVRADAAFFLGLATTPDV